MQWCECWGLENQSIVQLKEVHPVSSHELKCFCIKDRSPFSTTVQASGLTGLLNTESKVHHHRTMEVKRKVHFPSFPYNVFSRFQGLFFLASPHFSTVDTLAFVTDLHHLSLPLVSIFFSNVQMLIVHRTLCVPNGLTHSSWIRCSLNTWWYRHAPHTLWNTPQFNEVLSGVFCTDKSL